MNRVYSFAIKLQDLFSPQMQRIATMYEQRTTFMSRAWARVTGMMNNTVQTVANLRTRLSGLGSGFRIRLDSSDVDRASTRTSGLLAKLKSVAGQSAIIGGLVGGGVMGVIDSAVAFAGQGYDKTVGAAQRSQSTKFTLTELMGKASTDDLIKKVDAYAPERRDQLLTGAQKLSGAGVGSDKLMGTLKYLNNISALTGKSVEELAEIQGVIKSTGYVQGDEINRFKERGINLNPYLSKVLGVGEDQIAKEQAKGKITYDVFDKAMEMYAGKGSKYENVYERKMLSTTEGKEELVSGKFDAKMRGFGEKLLPIKDSILDMLNDVLNGTGPVVQMFDKLWSVIRPISDGVIRMLQYFGILNEQGAISQNVFNTLSVIWDYLGYVFEFVGKAVWVVAHVIGWLVNNPIAQLIVGVYAAVKAWLFLNAAFVATPIGFIITGIVAVIAAVMYAWDKFDGFREAVLRVWETVKTVFSNIGLIIKTMFTGTVGDMIELVKKTWNDGLTNGGKAVAADRASRIAEKQSKGKGNLPGIPGFDPLKPGKDSGSLAAAAGLNSTVGNSKSSSVVINVKSLIEKSDITINDFQGNYDELESKLIDAMLRVVNSGTRAVTA